jgi:multidrug efflux pump subunit AcrA (membrane-fusion protein)
VTNGKKKGLKPAVKLAIAAALVAAAALAAVRVASVARSKAKQADPAYTTVKVQRSELTLTVVASGQFEPNTITTIRPDSNMPTRKLVSILVAEGRRVTAGQALARVDATGLDLNLKSAQANYESQKVKLQNLRAKPADMELAAAEAALVQARGNVETQQENYDYIKALADKDLASRNQLSEAERQLSLARSNLEASNLSYQNVKAQSQADVIHAQEAAVTQADNDMQMARIVLDSATIRSPVAGLVAEVLVKEGDLVGPETAVMTVVDPDPMILQAQVNEGDMEMVRVGEKAEVTPSGAPDESLSGTVTGIDLHAQVQSNVSVFQTSISVPNPEGKILWGMNADAEITVMDLKNVFTVPNSAIHTVNGSSQLTIMDEGKPLVWDIQTGPTNGTLTQVTAGVEEGQEVVLAPRRTQPAGTQRQATARQPNMGQVFRVLH